MTAPTDREAALALLRERFPESEGWKVGVLDGGFDGPEVWASHGGLTEINEASRRGAADAARLLIASWDAATHADKVRALVVAAKALRSAADSLMGDSDLEGDDSPEFVAMQQVSSALAATPASLRGKGGGDA